MKHWTVLGWSHAAFVNDQSDFASQSIMANLVPVLAPTNQIALLNWTNQDRLWDLSVLIMISLMALFVQILKLNFVVR